MSQGQAGRADGAARPVPSALPRQASLYGYVAVRAAQRRYGVDLATAQRWAFAGWLRLTGRLSEW